jgi:hypothetical protein
VLFSSFKCTCISSNLLFFIHIYFKVYESFFFVYTVKLLKNTGQQWDQTNWLIDRVAGFVRLLLQRIVKHELQKLAPIHGGLVF